MFDEDESGFPRRRNLVPDADMDITPMIDVTFLLLIFFMVSSTMQGTPDRDIPPAVTGASRPTGGMLQLVVAAPSVAGAEPEFTLDGVSMSLEEVRRQLGEKAASADVEVMILAERRVPSGIVGEVEAALTEVERLKYHFAVQDRK